MAKHVWNENHPMVRRVVGDAHRFDFYQLLHLIERISADTPKLGHSGPAQREHVRLRPQLGLGFPPGDIDDAEFLEAPDGSGKLQITATFLGLYGSNSPLPAHVTEQLLPERDDDLRVRAFFDLFHHRIYSLLYRVWKKYRYHITFEPEGRDPISCILRGMLGIATPHLDDQLEMNPVRMFTFTGLLSQRPRSAEGLKGQIRAYFRGLPVDIQQCIGRWLWIQQDDRNIIGRKKCGLGKDFLLGEKIYDRSGKFRVQLGPLGIDDYARFLPGRPARQELDQIIRFYCEDPYEYDTEVTLKGDEVPDLPLRAEGILGRLAWTTWLKSVPSDDKSVIFQPARRGKKAAS